MRKLLTGIGLLGSLSVGSKPQAVFPRQVRVELFRNEGAVEFWRVFQKNRLWYCQTQHVPLFQAEQNPLQGFDWQRLTNEAQKPADMASRCTLSLKVEDLDQPQKSELFGCADKGTFRQFYHLLLERCRNKF